MLFSLTNDVLAFNQIAEGCGLPDNNPQIVLKYCQYLHNCDMIPLRYPIS